MDELIYNPNHIAKHFSRASASYNEAAGLQAQYIRRGLQSLMHVPNHARVLDLGAGTGNFARLAYQAGCDWHITGMDLSLGMCLSTAHQYSVNANMQMLPFADRSFDAAISAFALQWSNAPQEVFRELHRALKPGTTAIIQSFTEGTLNELRLCAEHAGDDVVNLFHSEAAYRNMATQAGFQVIESAVDTHIKIYEHPFALFHELKNLGATNSRQARNKSLGRRQKLKDIASYYVEHFGDSYGIPAAWNVIHMEIKRS